MKYVVIERGDKLSKQLTEQFHHLAEKNGFQRDKQDPDIVVSIGGDGTLLQAFQQYVNQLERVAFVGIHTGHLGFFADWQASEIETLIKLMRESNEKGTFAKVAYPLVDIEINTKENIERHVVLNEFTIKGIEETLVMQLNINDQMFEMFRGDGICFSTPCGSTAYNKSLGGALIHPSLEAVQIAEIASINNRVYRTLGSSMILPKHHHCDIYPQKKQNLLLTFDHLLYRKDDIVSVRCQISDQKVNFARFRPFPFWDRVREAFIGFDYN